MPLPFLLPLAASLASTGISMAGNAINKNKQVAQEDVMQRNFLNEVEAKRKTLAQGNDLNYKLAQEQISKNLATTQNAVLKTGSDIGSTLTGLNVAQQNAGSQSAKAATDLYNTQNFFTQLANAQIDKIAERRFGLQEQQHLQQLQNKKDIFNALGQNIMGAAAYGLGNRTAAGAIPTITSPNTTNTPISNMNIGTPVMTNQTAPNYFNPLQPTAPTNALYNPQTWQINT